MKQNQAETNIAIPEWKKEQEQLRQEKATLYEKYKGLHDELDKMLNVQHCIKVAQSGDRKKKQEKEKNQATVHDTL